MIWQQFRAILWLRWRLSVHQWKRGSSLNALLGLLLLVLGVTASISSFFVALAIGIVAFPKITPDQLMIMWDVIVVVFLFFWVAGLVTELQKSEALSLEKLLHLPVSLTGAYLLNYFSSWIALSMLVFVPTAIGLCVALAIVKGPVLLILFPLLLSFLIMITAITHQFRGWLQVLMVNKRRRRTIITLVTAGFFLLIQIPNVINIAVQRSHRKQGPSEHQQTVDQLRGELVAGEIDTAQYYERQVTLEQQRKEKRSQEKARKFRDVAKAVTLVNAFLPIGWLPMGARSAAAGNAWPGLVGTLGALLIGVGSLRRSYRVSLRLYTGGFGTGGFGTGAKQKKAKQKETPENQNVSGHEVAVPRNFLEKRFAWIPDQAAAVMLGGLRSMLRGPEGKMLLLSPLLMFGFFGVMLFWGRERAIPLQARPFLGIGVVSMVMLCFVQVLCNQFGFDRSGFRSLVLSPCPRRYMLLGKNLAIAPLVFGVGVMVVAVMQIFVTLKISHLLATLVQLLGAYVLYCLLTNVVSVLAPSAVAVGSLKPAKSKFLTSLIYLIAALLSPVAVLPGAVMLAAELLMHEAGWITSVPIYLLGSIVELGFALWLYRQVLPAQGRLLQQREQAVLDAVTARAE